MKKALRIIELIIQTILIIIIIINFISIVSVKILKNDFPVVFGYTFFSVLSGSMEPSISVGDEVIVKITDDVEINDVITFREDGAFVTHRLLDYQDGRYITKGDNNDSNDEPVYKGNVIGKVVLVIPFLGQLKYIFTNIYFIIALFGAYFVFELFVVKKND